MSKTIEVETVINAPLDDVWNEVSKIENHSNWMKDAVNIDFQTENKSGVCLLYTSPSPRDDISSRMPSSA